MRFKACDFNNFEVFIKAEVDYITLLERYGRYEEARIESTNLVEEIHSQIQKELKQEKVEKRRLKKMRGIGKLLYKLKLI